VPAEDRHAHDIFQAILDYVTDKRLQVVTMRDLAEAEAIPAISQAQDVVPRVTVRVELHRYLWHRLHAAGIRAPVVGVVVLTFVIGGAVLIAACRRRSGRYSAT